MSIKFRRDGAVFPTEVVDGKLIIYFGEESFSVPFSFLKEDYPKNNIGFPLSNIMCYLKNDNSTLIMRHDGTVTTYNKDGYVIGFSHFKRETIYKNTLYLPVGIVRHGIEYTANKHTKCSIYNIIGTTKFALECIGDLEPILFNPDDNIEFVKEVSKGQRYLPRLVRLEENKYAEDQLRYEIIGEPIKLDGFVNI